MRLPTSSRRLLGQRLSIRREEVLARQNPPYTVEYLSQWDEQWETHSTSTTFGQAFIKYAALDWPAKRVVDGKGRVVVRQID